MSCKVNRVEAPNGELSNLYENLLRFTGDQSRALELYVDLSGRSWDDSQLDENGEVRLDSIEDMSMFRGYEQARLNSSPAVANSFDRIENDVVRNIAKRLREAKRSLQRQINSDTSAEKREAINDRISTINDQIGQLVSEKSAGAIRRIGEEQLDWVEKVLNRSDPTASSLVHALHTTDLWDSDVTSEFLSAQEIENETTMSEVLLDLNNKSTGLRNRLKQKIIGWMIPRMESRLDRSVEPQDITVLQEPGWLTSNLYNIGHVDEKLINYLEERVKNDAVRNQSGWIKKVQNHINEASDAVKNDPDSSQESLLEKDEDGELTGELISPYTREYRNRRKSALESYYQAQEDANTSPPKEADTIINNAKEKLFSRLDSIENYIDIRILSDDFDTEKSANEYKSELYEMYGEERAEYAIAKAREMYLDYKRDLSGHKDYLESKIELGEHQNEKFEGESDSEYRERMIERYENRNSPVRFLDSDFDNNYSAWQNVNSLPKNQEFLNSEFENLTENEMELWNRFTTIINKSSEMLPEYESRNITDTFIPVIQKNYAEAFKEEGIRTAIRMKKDDWANEVLTDIKELEVEPEVKTDINPFSGAGSGEQAPIHYTGNKSDEEALSIEERTFDLRRIANMFFSMALNYKQMQEVTPEAQLIHRMVADANKKTDDDQIIEKGSGPIRLKKRVEDFINYQIYHDRIEEEFIAEDSPFSFITSMNPLQTYKDNVRRKEIEQERDELSRQLDEGEITREEFNEKIEELKKDYRELGGRSLIWGSLIDNTLLRFSQVKGMGYNVGAAMRNIAYGFISNYVHAAGDQEFNEKHVHRATGIVLQSIFNRNQKFQNLMEKFNILFETAEVKQGRDRENEAFDIYGPQNYTERIVQGITMVSMMLSTEVENQSGETTNLWQAFDADADWKTDEFGDAGEWALNRENYSEFQNKTNRLIQQIHGDYADDSNIPAKRYVVGRLLFQFKSWLPELFKYRFGKKIYDDKLGRKTEGIYRTIGRNARQNLPETLRLAMKSFATGFNPAADGSLESADLSENDVANIKRAMAELRIFSIITMAMLALSSTMSEGDDEDEYKKRYLINQLLRVQGDMTQYIEPNNAIRLIENPAPALRSIKDVLRATEGTYQYLSNEDYNGDNPAWKWMKAAPFTNQITSTHTKFERVMDN